MPDWLKHSKEEKKERVSECKVLSVQWFLLF